MTARGVGIGRGLAVLGGGTALAALLGLGFQSLLAFWFGAGAETDAFFMSLSIYGFLGKFLMLSHLRSLALPVYARVHGSDPARARRLAGGLLGITVAAVAVLSVVLFVVAPLLVDLLAPGYEGAMRELTVLLVRIRLPALVFLAGTTVAMAFLESEQRFGVTISAQKIVPAAVSLALLLAVADRSGIAAVAWIGFASTVAGALLIIPMARRRLASPALGAAARDPEIRTIGRGWLGLSGSNAATFVGEWAFRVGASLLPVGLFSAVLYGRMVHDLLHASINDSAQTMALPRFAAALTGEGGSVATPLRESLAGLAALSLPLALLVAATAPWSVALLFGRGQFLADGMLEPAAVSLALFMVGFFLQGLVQILFSAAFATHRSELINRAQLIGHLARAALLVPMTVWFSYVGLVGSQVAMNALVLALLIAWAPRDWGLGALRSSFLRPLAAAAVPAAVYVTVVAPRLPDPLELGTLGRLGMLGGIGAGWVVVYGALAAALRLPTAYAVARRLRRRTVTAAGVAVTMLVVPERAHGQEGPSWGPIAADHWALPVLEWLEARGEIPVGSAYERPLPAARVGALLRASEFGELFDEERGAHEIRASAGALLRGDGDEASLGSFVRADVGATSTFYFGFVELEHTTFVRGGIGLKAGKLWFAGGRERSQLGGGAAGAIVLNASAYLDGVAVGTAEPVRLGPLGEVTATAGAGPLPRYEPVEDPWWAHARVTLRPARWLQLGVSRAVLAGGYFPGGRVAYDAKPYGPDTASLSGSDVLRIILGRNTGYDNQVAAVDVRASWAWAGLPVVTYAELGLDDADRSWGDPALIVGAMWAGAAPLPVAVRYEYAAFGSGARLCSWCDTLPAFWYQHVRFQGGWRAGGELMGHALGGYGHQHSVIGALWSSNGRLRVEARLSAIDRERWNLLEDERPGSARKVELNGAWRLRPWLELGGELRDERGGEWRRSVWAIRANWFP